MIAGAIAVSAGGDLPGTAGVALAVATALTRSATVSSDSKVLSGK